MDEKTLNISEDMTPEEFPNVGGFKFADVSTQCTSRKAEPEESIVVLKQSYSDVESSESSNDGTEVNEFLV
ncbi:hypothetical protein PR048_019084 [Dryococelus australis]|uniref:Uncharacterized protein n=1 Tax=Dryococelus australis TaxID=614101 RepID=A0ABQ9H2H7_9NEOP|nr:hypothetical protein PR048_019084 [Dryococelus australis]